MCDYSLFEYPNRLAVEGEELVTYRFQSRSLGLVSLPELRSFQSNEEVRECHASPGQSTIWRGAGVSGPPHRKKEKS